MHTATVVDECETTTERGRRRIREDGIVIRLGLDSQRK